MFLGKDKSLPPLVIVGIVTRAHEINRKNTSKGIGKSVTLNSFNLLDTCLINFKMCTFFKHMQNITKVNHMIDLKGILPKY